MLQLDELDISDERPAYRQIAAILRTAIEDQRLPAGSRLPSESVLIEHFGVARMTIREAMRELRTEGLVIAKHGRGVFVRKTPPIRRVASDRFARKHREAGKSAFDVEAEAAGYDARVDNIRVRREESTPGVAERLQIPAGEEVVVRSRRYLADGQPVETAVSYIPARFAQGTRIEEVDTGPGGIYARLEENGHTLARFTEEVGARMPDRAEVHALGMGPGAPVLTVVRVAYDTDDIPVEVCETVKMAAAYLLEYEFPAR